MIFLHRRYYIYLFSRWKKDFFSRFVLVYKNGSNLLLLLLQESSYIYNYIRISCWYILGKTLCQIFRLYISLKNKVFEGNLNARSKNLEDILKKEFGDDTVMINLKGPKYGLKIETCLLFWSSESFRCFIAIGLRPLSSESNVLEFFLKPT